MKRSIILSILIVITCGIINSQNYQNQKFDTWSGSYKFEHFFDESILGSKTIKSEKSIVNDFTIWTNSKKFYEFGDESFHGNITNNSEQTVPQKQETEESVIESESAPEVLEIENAGFTSNKVNLYPNPVKDRLNISLNFALSTNFDVTVFNSIGNIVHTFSLLDKKQLNKVIDVSDLNRGIYFVEIKTANEKILRKIIVK